MQNLDLKNNIPPSTIDQGYHNEEKSEAKS
jgi:hypothetical protein